MGKYEEIKGLKKEAFRRLTGVKPQTFEKMAEILRQAQEEKKRHGGRPNKLSIEDMLLMAFNLFAHITNACANSRKFPYYVLVK